MFSFSSRPAAGAGSGGGGDLAEKVRARRRLSGTRGPHAAPRRAVRHGHTPSPLRAHSRATRNRSPPGVAGQGVEVGAAERDARAGPADQRCARPRVRAGGRREEERAVGAGARSAQVRQPAAPSRCDPAADAHRARAAQPFTHAAILRHARCGQLPAAAPAPPPALPCPAGAHSPRLACRGPARGGEAQARDRAVRQEGPGDCDDAGQECGACRVLVTRGTGWLAGRAGLRVAAARPWRGSMRHAARPLRPRAPDRHPAARTHGAARAAASPPVQCCSHTIALHPHFCSPPCAPPARTATF